MIKINLIQKRKSVKIPSVFHGVSFKVILIAVALLYIPDFFLKTGWPDEIVENQKKLKSLKSKLIKLKLKSREQKDLQKKIAAYTKKENDLKNRLEVVKQIIEERRNPMEILHYISKNIPDELWVRHIGFSGNDFNLKGESTTYKGIGLFMKNLKKSIFFGNSIRLKDTKTVENKIEGERTEYFEIIGTIERFQ